MKVVKGFVESYTVRRSKYGLYANYKIMQLTPPLQIQYNVKGKCAETDTIVS